MIEYNYNHLCDNSKNDKGIVAIDRVPSKLELLFKRCFDLLIVFLALIGTFPLLIITSVAIRLDSTGPIIFKQTRLGKGGKPFTCYKFRSMYVDAEERKAELMPRNDADGPLFKMQNDPRITRVGSIIRKRSIDELPQLFNIIKGDMSIVGPRPPLPQEVEQYTELQLRRLDVVPGLTGLQQISGRSNLKFDEWIQLDLQYIDKQSLWLDIVIMCKTISVVLLGRGAY